MTGGDEPFFFFLLPLGLAKAGSSNRFGLGLVVSPTIFNILKCCS
jgi:hypothetical protein